MKQKILIFNHASVVGGAGVALLNIIDSLDKELYDITVYCTSNQTQIAEMLEARGIGVVRAISSPVCYMHYNGGECSALSVRYYKNLIRIHKDKANVKRAIEKCKPDIVIVNSMTLYWIGAIAQKLGCKTICFHRESYAKGWVGFRTWKLKRKLDKYFDRIAFISNFDMEKTKLKKAEGFVLPDCIQIEKFNTMSKSEAREYHGLDQEAYYVLFLGGCSHLKGADVIMRAVDICEIPNLKLLLLNGEKPQNKIARGVKNAIKKLFMLDDEKRLYNVYSGMEHPERIVFCKSSVEVPTWYAACDLVVFPSTKAHQAMPIYEAGMAERLMIISDFVNTREFLENEKNGLTFPPSNSEVLAAKIQWANENAQSEKYMSMLATNKQMSIDNHQFENFKKQVRDLVRYG